MGSIISYYLNSSSMQALEDYISSHRINLFFKDESESESESEADDNSHNRDITSYLDDDSNYYKLYIYVHNSDIDKPNYDLKNMYEESSMRHNIRVDKYLRDCGINLSNKGDIDENKPINCYDSGFDLFCPHNIYCNNIYTHLLDHNISCAMTYKGMYVGYYVYVRSSTPIKTPLRLANNVGIIDSGYRGNIKAYFDIIDRENNFKFEKGNRYTQLCPPDIGKPMKVIIADSMSMLGENSTRKTGGLGSTGD